MHHQLRATRHARAAPDVERTRALARLHRVLGLTAGVFFTLLGLSGSILVFRPEVDTTLDPSAYATAGPVTVTPDAAVAAALRAEGGIAKGVSPPLARSFPDRTTFVVYIALESGTTSKVYVDPRSARVLAIRGPHDRLTDWVYDLHTTLLLQGLGKNVVATIGIVIVVVALLGLALWPGWRVARSGFTFKRGASLRRRSFDAHKLVGIVSMTFLVMLGTTGTLMTWYETVNAALMRASAATSSPQIAPHGGREPLSLAKQLALGDAALPGTQVAYFDVAGNAGDMPQQSRRAPRDPDRTFGSTTLYLDPYSGRVARIVSPYRDVAAWYTWFFNLHSGMAWAQPAFRLVIFLAGLAPAALLLSSLFVWRERARALRRQRGRVPLPRVAHRYERKGAP